MPHHPTKFQGIANGDLSGKTLKRRSEQIKTRAPQDLGRYHDRILNGMITTPLTYEGPAQPGTIDRLKNSACRRMFSVSPDTFLALPLKDQLALGFSTLLGMVLIVLLSPALLLAGACLLYTHLRKRWIEAEKRNISTNHVGRRTHT